MRKHEKREIDGWTYECFQFEVKKSLRVLTRLSKRAKGPLSKLVDGYDPKRGLLESDVDTGGIVESLMEAITDLGDDEIYDLAKDICSDVIANSTATMVGGKLSDVFDQHFNDVTGIVRLFKVCKFALEVNYGNFLAALGVVASQQEKVVASERSSTRVK